MKIVNEMVTPLMAAALIKRINPAYQRKLMPTVVDNYANTMRSGHWILSTDCIAEDVKERLINGMHRLYAVVKSGKTVPMLIAYGVPENNNGTRTIDVIDCGKGRTVGQQLSLTLGHNAAPFTLASACRHIALTLVNSKLANTTVITKGILDIYAKEIEFVVEHRSTAKFLNNGALMAGFAICIAYEARAATMREMFVSAMTGENLEKGSPALTLRNQLMAGKIARTTKGGSRSLGLRTICAVTLCAKHYLDGKKIENIRYTDYGLEFFKSKQVDRIKKVRTLCGVS